MDIEYYEFHNQLVLKCQKQLARLFIQVLRRKTFLHVLVAQADFEFSFDIFHPSKSFSAGDINPFGRICIKLPIVVLFHLTPLRIMFAILTFAKTFEI